jgi:phosphate:Na+ symporter
MDSTVDLLNLLGAGALLIWGLRLIKTGVLRAFGASLRRWVARGTRNRVAAALSGFLTTVALQSSTATAVITASFAVRSIVKPRMAQAVMLGANVGTAVAALVLSLDLRWVSPAMIFIGVAAFSLGHYSRAKNVGRALLGLGLMLLALQLLAGVIDPLRQVPAVVAVLGAIEQAPVLALALGAALAFIASSSLAAVLVVALFAQAGVVSPALAVVLVAGANLGGAVPPWLVSRGEGVEARRLTLTNLAVRGAGALVLVVFAAPAAALLHPLVPDPRSLVIAAHIAFNLCLVAVFLPLLDPLTRIAARLIPPTEAQAAGPNYLDASMLETPAMALAAAGRETLRVGDLVRQMLESCFDALVRQRPDAREATSGLDDTVDRLQQAVKLYIARLDRDALSPEDVRRSDEIISYAINLEHVGDVIDRGLASAVSRKHKRQVTFSAEGLAELTALYRKTIENMTLAQTVFLTRDPELARQLVGAKVEVRQLEQRSAERHLERVREQRAETLESSTLHLDILRDLKRINSHLTSVAYPILEELGVLQESRLRAAPADRPAAAG